MLGDICTEWNEGKKYTRYFNGISFSQADCTRTPLTTEVVVKQRDLLASKYTSSSDLDACLPDDVLRNNLETLGKMEFQDPLLQVLKLKLDKVA